MHAQFLLVVNRCTLDWLLWFLFSIFNAESFMCIEEAVTTNLVMVEMSWIQVPRMDLRWSRVALMILRLWGVSDPYPKRYTYACCFASASPFYPVFNLKNTDPFALCESGFGRSCPTAVWLLRVRRTIYYTLVPNHTRTLDSKAYSEAPK